MQPIVRPIEARDETQWHALWTAYLAFYESRLPEDVTASTFQRLINPARTAQFAFVAEQERRLIGLVHAIVHHHNWRVEDVVYLQDLFVSPDMRGTGAGRALIEAVYAAADANGTPTVYWLTQDNNATARQLYDRIGTLTPFVKYQR